MSKVPGVWPVMLTPFRKDGAVDFEGLDALTEWYIKCGVSGIFSVCLSSEMYDLTDEERTAVASRVVSRVGGRVPIFASGTFEPGQEAQIDSVRRMADTGVNGVVVIVCQMAEEGQDNTTWRKNVEVLLKSTGEVPLGLYECPRPYHRLLDADTLGWCGSTGRFAFVKDTSSEEASIAAKLEATDGSPLRFYDACAATLWRSLEHGADGFCGVAANLYADLYVWIFRNYREDPETARQLHRFVSVAERAIGIGYPSSAKLYLQKLGLPITSRCRVKQHQFSERDLLILDDLTEMICEWRERIGSPLIEEVV
ncbi:MAG: dihydrodipicolinate synthase family protein [Gemmatimonadetes bacterium]|nr:dihydrodipicolinate synthase family protein [Gemmatimonadota bacterium]